MYAPTGDIVESFQCVRSFKLNQAGDLIQHQNHYNYGDGRQETKSFGPYRKPHLRSLFLENSFSWGSDKVTSGHPFGFETGFRCGNRRMSVAARISDPNLDWQTIVVITEQLEGFTPDSFPTLTSQFNNSCQGVTQTKTPDWLVSESITVPWRRLADLQADYLNLLTPNGIGISIPKQVANESDFTLAVDWLVEPGLLYRGVRTFKQLEFVAFRLTVFDAKGQY